MGEIFVSHLDDATLARLEVLARERATSVEALARDAINKVVKPSVEEKRAIVRRMQAITERAKVPGILQTLGVDLIREDRDR